MDHLYGHSPETLRMYALARNPAAPADVLLRLVRHRGLHLLADRADLPPDLYDALVVEADHRPLLDLLEMSLVPVGRLAALVDHPKRQVRAALAAHVHWQVRDGIAPPDAILARLAADPEPLVRLTVAHDMPTLPAAVRQALLADPDPVVRATAVDHWADAPDEIVDRLLDDTDPTVRAAAVRRGCRTRPELVAPVLAVEEPKGWPARWVAEEAALDRPTAQRFARHPDQAWRAAVAYNPHLPADLVDELGRDPSLPVRLAVSLRPELTEQQRAAIDYQVDPGTRVTVPTWFSRRLDDLDLLRRCAHSAHVGLRRFAATSRWLPPDLVALLAADEDFAVRLMLCEHHPDPPGGLLLATYLEREAYSLARLLRHPNFPTVGLARLADSPAPRARALVAHDPQAPPALIERLSHDDTPEVRSAMARDGRLPLQRLMQLFDDRELAGSAAANPRLPVPMMLRVLTDAGVPELTADDPAAGIVTRTAPGDLNHPATPG
ncbi:hypothetical protein ACPFP2_20460 [Micromonospora citrea]|uniref:hypothetical protein n=1 Tax=Micromonospora citrea TaxID=47855 RepID=UPI003C44E4CD